MSSATSFSKSSSGSTPSAGGFSPGSQRVFTRGGLIQTACKWARSLRMAVATRGTASNYLQRAPSPSGLVDVVDLILDKGLVIDAYIRVSVIGIELVTIDARIVIASVDTYLRFAEAVNRLDLNQTELSGLPELREAGAEEVVEHKIEHAEDELSPDS